MILAFVIVAVILFILAAVFSRPSLPGILLAAGLAFWAASTILGQLWK